jgi:hypothetical protein
LQSGLIDAFHSLDRYCLYTMYRDIDLVSFERIPQGERSDTEIQASTWTLRKEKYIPPPTSPELCRPLSHDSSLCQATQACGWCQIESSGACYELNETNYLGCLAFDGAWIGKEFPYKKPNKKNRQRFCGSSI